MNKHTPGPWKTVDREVFSDGSVYPRHILGGPDELVVCYLESQFASGDPTPQREATARLIAAAPDLLNALDALSTAADSRGIPCDAARAAIAKARGEL